MAAAMPLEELERWLQACVDRHSAASSLPVDDALCAPALRAFGHRLTLPPRRFIFGLEKEAMKTYRGSCHCKKVRFEIDAEIDHVRACDCSICDRRSALIYRVQSVAFRLLPPLSEEHLSLGLDDRRRFFLPRLRYPAVPKPSDPTTAELGREPRSSYAYDEDRLIDACARARTAL